MVTLMLVCISLAISLICCIVTLSFCSSVSFGMALFHIFHISYFHILNIFIQGTNSISILFYNLALLKLKNLINYLQID